MLPQTLLIFLLDVALVAAQNSQTLSLNGLASFTPQTLPNPPTFTLPSSDVLAVSVAVCSGNSQSGLPRFFVTNDTSTGIPSSNGGSNVFEIVLNEGMGNWTGFGGNGGLLAVENGGQVSFEIGVTSSGPFHEHLSTPPLLGDTTSNQALLFSQPFAPAPNDSPSYPNYTLPQANPPIPAAPVSPNLTLIISPTSSNPSLTSVPQTGCRLAQTASTGNQLNQTLWLKDSDGWRSQWLLGGLNPVTNYTAYVIQDNTKISGPIMFATKSAAFACPIVHSLPYCPSTSYAVPLANPPNGAPAYDSTNLPSSLSTPILTYMTNFTTTLTTFACGRDMYSPLQSCASCQVAYRKWLCAVSLPRCSEASPGSSSSTSQLPSGTAQQPFSALLPQATDSPSRSPSVLNMTSLGTEWNSLLPCLETCTAVDRACPNFLGFKCPVVRFNANESYGVGYIDSGEDGVEGRGMTGDWQDRWGNIWCNGS